MKTWVTRWGPAFAIMSFIFLASATPGSELPEFGIWDTLVYKGGHMTGYALLAASFMHALIHFRDNKTIRLLIAFCLTILYAASDEWHQGFTSGRSPTLQDVIIDGIGALIGLALWHLIQTHVVARHRAD